MTVTPNGKTIDSVCFDRGSGCDYIFNDDPQPTLQDDKLTYTGNWGGTNRNWVSDTYYVIVEYQDGATDTVIYSSNSIEVTVSESGTACQGKGNFVMYTTGTCIEKDSTCEGTNAVILTNRNDATGCDFDTQDCCASPPTS